MNTLIVSFFNAVPNKNTITVLMLNDINPSESNKYDSFHCTRRMRYFIFYLIKEWHKTPCKIKINKVSLTVLIATCANYLHESTEMKNKQIV